MDANKRGPFTAQGGTFRLQGSDGNVLSGPSKSPRRGSLQIGRRLLALIRVHWRLQILSRGSGAHLPDCFNEQIRGKSILIQRCCWTINHVSGIFDHLFAVRIAGRRASGR